MKKTKSSLQTRVFSIVLYFFVFLFLSIYILITKNYQNSLSFFFLLILSLLLAISLLAFIVSYVICSHKTFKRVYQKNLKSLQDLQDLDRIFQKEKNEKETNVVVFTAIIRRIGYNILYSCNKMRYDFISIKFYTEKIDYLLNETEKILKNY